METITLDHDIKVFYVTAKSFPNGIMEAYGQLYALVPPSSGRRYFGISRPENGVIVYRAAVEEATPGEAEKYHCDTMVLQKGKYLARTIADFMSNLPAVGATFQQLIAQPGVDLQGYCVEWYLNDKDVTCMVRLA